MKGACPIQTMNISLPEPLKQFVEEQVSGGGYSSASEYVRELVRADQQRRAKERLEEILIAALRSGEPMDATSHQWEELRQQLQGRAKGREAAAP
jgi:antitoxin ParD1/3/4